MSKIKEATKMMQGIKKRLIPLTVLSFLLNSAGVLANNQTLSAIEAKLKTNDANVSQITMYLQDYLKDSPNEHQARLLLARAYFRVKEVESATQILLEAKKMGASPNLWMPPLAKMYLLTYDYAALLENMTEHDLVRYRDPVAPSLLTKLILYRGKALLGTYQVHEAKVKYLALLQQDPSLEEAWLGLANAYILDKKIQKATSALEEAKKLSKGIARHMDAQILTTQAGIYRLQNNVAQAKLAYEHALRLEPNNLAGRLGVTHLLWENKEMDAFFHEAESLYQLLPKHPDVLYYAALSQQEQGNNKEAKRLLKILKSFSFEHPNVKWLQAKIYFTEQKFELAQKTLQSFLRANPEDAAGNALMASIQIKLKAPEKAAEVLGSLIKEEAANKKALSPEGSALKIQGKTDHGEVDLARVAQSTPKEKLENPENPDLEKEEVPVLGEKPKARLEEMSMVTSDIIESEVLSVLTALQNGDLQQAEELGLLLLEDKPDSPLAENVMGLVQRAKGDEEKAIAHFKRAIEQDSEFVTAQNNISEIFIRQQRYPQAKLQIKDTLTKSPNNLRALLLQAKLDELEGNDQAALFELQKAVDLNTETVEPGLELVSFYLRNSDNERALIQAKALQQRFSGDLRVLQLLGQLSLSLQDYEEAKFAFTELSNKTEPTEQIYQNLALSEYHLGHLPKAKAALEKVLQFNAENMQAIQLSTEIAYQEKDYQQALSLAEKCITTAPELPTGHQWLGKIYMALGEPHQAVGAYEKAYDLLPSSENVKALFLAKRQISEKVAGYDLLNTWINLNPKDVESRRLLATHYLLDEQIEDAKREYEALLADFGDDSIVLNNLATLYLTSDVDRAFMLANKAYELVPEAPEIGDTLAWVLVQKEEPLKAKRLLERALQKTPDNPEIQYHYAVALEKMGDINGAKEMLAKILHQKERKPDFPEYKQASLMWEALSNGSPKKATG